MEPIRDMKEKIPTQFPSDRSYTYSPMTLNTPKRAHIKKYHLDIYLEEAKKNSWTIWLDSVKVAFTARYTFQTLHQALAAPGMSIHSLPPLHREEHQGSSTLLSGCIPLENGLPPFSILALQQYLMQFIVADDQVRYINSWLVNHHSATYDSRST